MARNTKETNVNTNANAVESIESVAQQEATIPNVLELVPAYGTDAIQVKALSNNFYLNTNKLKVQTSISLGRDQKVLAMNTPLRVAVLKQFKDDSKASVSFNMTVAALLTVASNGLFELFNTNIHSEPQLKALVVALENGYFYPSSYELSQKQPAFNWANFIIWLKEQDYSQSELAPKVAKFLTLTTRQISSLTDEQLRQVSWLYPLIVSKGYSPAKPAEQSLLADLM